MRNAVRVAAIAIAAVVAVATGPAAQSKWVRGKVTAIQKDAVIVRVGDRDFTFKVEPSTRLIARGGSTATREAQASGRPGPMLSELVKVGQNIQVDYREAGGVMTATEIRPVVAAEGTSQETSASSFRGTVTAVTADALTVKGADNQDVRFGLDPKVNVIGTGVGTKARTLKEAGKPVAVPELVGAGDSVVVSFVEVGGNKLAKEIRVLSRSR